MKPERSKIKEIHTVCAVIVTHNIGADVEHAINAILPEVDWLVLVDTHSTDFTPAIIEKAALADPARIFPVHLKANNLAHAQNTGIVKALELQADAVLLLDHDSIATPEMLAQMKHAFAAGENIGLVAPDIKEAGADAPTLYLTGNAWQFSRRRFVGEPYIDDALYVISSGSLIPLDTFPRVGMMDETLVIDYIDQDFCLRLKKAGLNIRIVKDAVLTHRIGRKETHKLGGANIVTSNHSPERRYTIYRNRIRLWFRYAAQFPSFVFYDLGAVLYDLFRIATLEDQKWQKFKAIFRGLKDALLR